jgi:hypothetical protein
MTPRYLAQAILALVVLTFPGAERCICAPAQQPDSLEHFRQLLQGIAGLPPDPCGAPNALTEDENSTNSEAQVFDRAAQIVADGLNATPNATARPEGRATDALKVLENMSAEINATWPEGNRFHFEILDLSPALVVKMTVRMHAEFFVFGIPEENAGKPNRLWQMIGSDDNDADQGVAWSQLDLYPLHRGRSSHARFLATFKSGGCAGSYGVAYDAREWNPEGEGNFERVIKQSGAFGLDDKVPGFQRIGKLQTQGSAITLPYCWFSAIDTWDNPSLCAVDTYDVSGDSVLFRSRAYNRPDLAPVAKAIEYAQQRDYEAVLGYCASAALARRMVRDMPPFVFAGNLQVTHTGSGRERVELGDGPTYRVDIEKRGGRWLVVTFNTER